MSLSPTRSPRTIALAGLTVAGALLATAACSNSATPSGSSVPSEPSVGKYHHAKGVGGKITAENGSTWTVVNAKGKQFTVDITPQTKFGTKAVPATQQQFTVGEQIHAAGQVTNGTVAANRIIKAKDNAGAPSS
jgi:hypothetical protein